MIWIIQFLEDGGIYFPEFTHVRFTLRWNNIIAVKFCGGYSSDWVLLKQQSMKCNLQYIWYNKPWNTVYIGIGSTANGRNYLENIFEFYNHFAGIYVYIHNDNVINIYSKCVFVLTRYFRCWDRSDEVGGYVKYTFESTAVLTKMRFIIILVLKFY